MIRIISRVFFVVCVVLPIFCIGFVLTLYIATPYKFFRVTSNSIEPGIYLAKTVDVKEKLLKQKYYCFEFNPPHKWIIERNYLPLNSMVCKKLIGVEKDTIYEESNRVVIIDSLTKEKQILPQYLAVDSKGRKMFKHFTQKESNPATIEENKLFLYGDKAPNSLDSRYLGTIDRSSVKLTLVKKLIG